MTVALVPVKYDEACRLLAEAAAVDEVKHIHNVAIAMQAYARQAKNRAAETDAIAIRMRAARRLGQLMQAQKETVGLNRGAKGSKVTGLKKNPVMDDRPTLASQGIDKTLAHQARLFWALDDATFEDKIDDARRSAGRVFRRLVREVEIEQEREERRAQTALGGNFADLEALFASGFRAGVIYADPPWLFEVYSGKGKERSAERRYDTQPLDEIKALPVEQLAADDCALLLWAVCPELSGAFEVIKAWGFEFKTVAFAWVKSTKEVEGVTLDGAGLHWGMGYHTRANIELCLLATRGSPLRLAADVHQVVLAPVGEHSAKPEEVAQRIERLYGGPYLELYARKPREGWAVWGDELPSEAAE